MEDKSIPTPSMDISFKTQKHIQVTWRNSYRSKIGKMLLEPQSWKRSTISWSQELEPTPIHLIRPEHRLDIINLWLFHKEKFDSDEKFLKDKCRIVTLSQGRDTSKIGQTYTPTVNPISLFMLLAKQQPAWCILAPFHTIMHDVQRDSSKWNASWRWRSSTDSREFSDSRKVALSSRAQIRSDTVGLSLPVPRPNALFTKGGGRWSIFANVIISGRLASLEGFRLWRVNYLPGVVRSWVPAMVSMVD